MKRLLIHGCYDHLTLDTLVGLGVQRFAFDLRARSSNLIPYSSLKILLSKLAGREVTLVFQDDKLTTVVSFLDLLKATPVKCVLEFRDQLPVEFYQSVNHPFIWMFHPEADWTRILNLPHLRAVLLPLEWREDYQDLPQLWEIIEARNLEVLLHTANVEEASELAKGPDLNLSLDITKEMERGYRHVDQDKLKNLELWRHVR